jgi:hypothetical protein
MLPGNIILRALPPYVVLGGGTICFGVLLCGMSDAQGYAAVMATRILIGCFQAFIQGIGLYISVWYKRHEMATRSGNSTLSTF